MPQLTWKVDLGHVLTIAVILAGGLIAYGRISSDLEALKKQVNQVGVLTERIIKVETRVDTHLEQDQVLKPSDAR